MRFKKKLSHQSERKSNKWDSKIMREKNMSAIATILVERTLWHLQQIWQFPQKFKRFFWNFVKYTSIQILNKCTVSNEKLSTKLNGQLSMLSMSQTLNQSKNIFFDRAAVLIVNNDDYGGYQCKEHLNNPRKIFCWLFCCDDTQ